MMNVSENLYATITEKVNEVDTPVVSINASLNADGKSFGLNINIINKDLLTTNITDVQTQIDTFINSVKQKMTELGYEITI